MYNIMCNTRKHNLTLKLMILQNPQISLQKTFYIYLNQTPFESSTNTPFLQWIFPSHPILSSYKAVQVSLSNRININRMFILF